MRKQTLEIKDIFLIFLVSAALLASASILLRFLIKTYYEKSTEAYQNKLVKNQIEEVNNVYMTMRGWRHDYHNHMQKIRAHLALGEVEPQIIFMDRNRVQAKTTTTVSTTARKRSKCSPRVGLRYLDWRG